MPPPQQPEAQVSYPPPHAQATVPNYLVPAILTTLFCCLPFGIVSIVYAAQVNGKLAAGDRAGALQASQNAKTWAWLSFGFGIFLLVVLLFLQFV
jgi:Interferon-induced transmembrane protein